MGNACGGKPGSHGSKAILLSHARGVEPPPCLSLPAQSMGSGTIETLVHQMPDMRIYRVGPQPRGPLYVPDTPKKGPQAREPSKCLNGQSYGESLTKEASWSPATGGWKKDSDRAITPAVEAVHVPAHLALPVTLQARQLHHLHTQLTGAEQPQAKKS